MGRISEAIGNVAAMVMRVTARRSHGKMIDLVIEHELPGVTPEMIDWWWDNIDTTERYRMWHPASHLRFEWERECDGHLGRIHRVTEKIGAFPTTLRIRWEDPESVPVERVYGHVNAGGVLDNNDQPLSYLVHQYESMPGGTRMRSTFLLPEKTPKWFIEGLRKHNREEMAEFTRFLPELYAGRESP